MHICQKVFVRINSNESDLELLPHIPGTVITKKAPRLSKPLRLAAVSRYQYFVPHGTKVWELSSRSAGT